MNNASINITSMFIYTCESTLERVRNAKTESEKSAILNRETVQGIKFAIEFASSLGSQYMTERELKHAIRLCYFRGNNCPTFNG